MENSQIMWTHNTQNFWVGCDKIAPECAKCYIKRPLLMQGREPWGSVYRTSKKLWKDPLDWQQEAQQAHGCLRIFTCSLSDFFHAKADPWRDEAWDIIRRTPHLVWLVLTKRPELIEKRLPKDWPYPNVWLGVSSGARMTLNKMDTLRGIPVHPKAVRFLSAEPLIEDISADIDLTGFGWVIIGGESGSNPEYLWNAAGDWRKEFSTGGRRTMRIEWAAALRDKVKAAGLPLAFKQVTASRSGVGEDALGRSWHKYPPPPLELPWAPVTDAAAIAPAEPEQPEGTLSPATVAAIAPTREPTTGIQITDDDLQAEFGRGYEAGYEAHKALHAAMGNENVTPESDPGAPQAPADAPDELDEDALIEQYDPDREEPGGRPIYKVMLTVTGSKLESMLKKAKEAFGEALLKVEKFSRTTSRADQLANAIERVRDAKDDIESLKSEIESWHENLPDSFRDGEKGSQLEECMEALEQVINSLDDAESNADSVDFPGMY